MRFRRELRPAGSGWKATRALRPPGRAKRALVGGTARLGAAWSARHVRSSSKHRSPINAEEPRCSWAREEPQLIERKERTSPRSGDRHDCLWVTSYGRDDRGRRAEYDQRYDPRLTKP